MPITFTPEQIAFIQTNFVWLILLFLFIISSATILFWKLLGLLYRFLFKRKKVYEKSLNRKLEVSKKEDDVNNQPSLTRVDKPQQEEDSSQSEDSLLPDTPAGIKKVKKRYYKKKDKEGFELVE